MHRFLLILLLTLCSPQCPFAQTLETGVLVIGGGTGGTAAGIQSARMGIASIITEPTRMLGGMLTAAGVSCTDGNHQLKSGIWEEFRQALYQHYGTTNLATGWVSETCFEPHVGDSIFKSWAAKEKNLHLLFGYHFLNVIKNGNRVTGAVFSDSTGAKISIHAAITIDATELGDVFAKAGAAFHLGMDDAKETHEPQAPGKNNIIQDLTWTAILKDYGKGTDQTIPMPAGYKAERYFCCCTDAPCNAKAYPVSAQKMLDYARLPNDKFMLNWPAHGNDTYLNVAAASDSIRNVQYETAKSQTLGFIYFIQTKLGFKNIGLAYDELDSGMALIPYNREGRRLQGLATLTINEVANPYAYTLFRTGISVGDYPVDHHHGQYPGKVPAIAFPKIPSFNIPLGSLIPSASDGLIVCEKGISVSNIVNGSTRLQPCVMLTGQAAGALAALSVQQEKHPRAIAARTVQSALLRFKCYLMPFVDIEPTDPKWEAIQRIGVTGILKARGVPEGWENKTFFDPDSTIMVSSFEKGLAAFYHCNDKPGNEDSMLTIGQAFYLLLQHAGFATSNGTSPLIFDEMSWYNKLRLQRFDLKRPIRRAELAVMIDYYAHPFETAEVDFSGKQITGDKRSLPNSH
jgi:hypothetical protein